MASVELQSEDHRNLLDLVDQLRLLGISNYNIQLPQIVVCGDQSSGKSSVLEAISGIRFPTKETLCTRFATEMILRRSQRHAMSVSIIPSEERTPEEKARLEAFTFNLNKVDLDLTGAINAATATMGISDSRRFAQDTLRVVLEGPDQIHLTLVDLPGIFHSGNSEQSAEEIPLVNEMVLGYIKQSRSIILAVVSAEYDFSNQKITEYTREHDQDGHRTLGLITKPDRLPVGSDLEAICVKRAKNEDIKLDLGWHVLRNRDFHSRAASKPERDEQERHFFRKGAWASLSPMSKGADTLRSRLSKILTEQIIQNIPSLISEAKHNIVECKAKLAELGQPRHTVGEQRRYLRNVTSRFNELLMQAIDGNYHDGSFFTSAETDDGYRKRLRAVIQNSLVQFTADVDIRGHALRIVDEESESEDIDHKDARKMSRSRYAKRVQERMYRTRGKELPGTFNPLLVTELFREQCQPWQALAVGIRDKIMASVRWIASAILQHVAISDTYKALNAKVSHAIGDLGRELDDKIDELLQPYFTGHPITYNHYLISNVQKAQAHRRETAMLKLLQSLQFEVTHKNNTTANAVDVSQAVKVLSAMEEKDMEAYASNQAVDYMQAYYKVAKKSFIDNMSTLAIEQRLISRLPFILTSELLDDLSDNQVKSLAAEDKSASEERSHNAKKLRDLEETLGLLQDLDMQSPPIEDHSNIVDASDNETAAAQPPGTPSPPQTRQSRAFPEVAVDPMFHFGSSESASVITEAVKAVPEIADYIDETDLPRASLPIKKKKKSKTSPTQFADWDLA